MSCWTSRKVSGVLIVIALVLLWITEQSGSIVCGVLTFAFLALDVTQTVVFCRRPHCGRLIRAKGLRMPLYCPARRNAAA